MLQNLSDLDFEIQGHAMSNVTVSLDSPYMDPYLY